MTPRPTIDEIFAVMAAASVGDGEARVAVPDDVQVDDTATRLAIGLNLLLDDLAFRSAQIEAADRVTRMELEHMVAERTLELKNVNQELEAFSYSVAHDLRAPLRSMDGFSQALLEDYADRLDARGQDYLNRVRAAARRMGELIDDLLQLSRVARAELHRGRVNLSALAQAVVADLQRRDPDRHVEVHIEDNLIADADDRLMRVVLDNLLGNAWKFSARAAAPCLHFGREAGADGAVYVVRDNGAGFDMAYADKLFRPFQRLHAASEFPGTGIGLATVRRIVERHSGRVWAEGAVGRGAAVYFTLPSANPGGAA